jgi:hypothetical protein
MEEKQAIRERIVANGVDAKYKPRAVCTTKKKKRMMDIQLSTKNQ